MTTPTHQSALGVTFAVVRSALRLLWRHWPVLVALALAGFAARQGLLFVSVKASALSPILAVLVFALVPVSMLVPMLVMMRVVRRSLPEPTPAKLGDGNSFLARIASVLVPFLAVYAAYQYFKEDEQTFRYEVWFDETLNNPELFSNPSAVNTAERLPTTLNLTLIIVIIASIGLRQLFGLLARKRPGNLPIGFSRAYLEATWISLTVLSFEPFFDWGKEFFLGRQLWAWVLTLVDNVTSPLGPLAPAARTVVHWFGQIFTSVDSVIIIPFAWLTIGCVIYGHELISFKRSGVEAAVSPRRQRGPGFARNMMLPLRNSVDERFGPMVRGFRRLRLAGLRTMLMFCLAFVVAQSLPEWLWELVRRIVGPQDLFEVWVPLSGPLSSFSESIGLVLTICLVAAAVDHVLRVPDPSDPVAPEPAPGPETRSPAADAQPDVAGELAYPSYLYGDGLDAGGRDEKDRGSVLT